MLYLSKPIHFRPDFQVVSLYLEYNGTILLLHRLPHKSQGNKWGVPAGKVDADENLIDALAREVFEETGVRINVANTQHFKTVYGQHPENAFIYHMYHLRLTEKPEIKTAPGEHQSFKWVSPSDALTMHLVDDLDTCITLFYFR